jgi:hypothetical protein
MSEALLLAAYACGAVVLGCIVLFLIAVMVWLWRDTLKGEYIDRSFVFVLAPVTLTMVGLTLYAASVALA